MMAAIQDFLEHEAELLDGRRFREWLELFAPDDHYWIPVSPDQRDPLASPSHVYELRPVLAARVERLYDSRVVPQQPPSRTSRLLGPARLEGETAGGPTAGGPTAGGPTAGGPVARVKFQLVEARTTHEAENEIRVFAGTARYGLRPEDGGFRIAWKRIDLIDSEAGLRGISIVF
jgi:3-phenylpropionate/cinnamic acid dioxygenase small subunit